jgi:hypothetical protein
MVSSWLPITCKQTIVANHFMAFFEQYVFYPSSFCLSGSAMGKFCCSLTGHNFGLNQSHWALVFSSVTENQMANREFADNAAGIICA